MPEEGTDNTPAGTALLAADEPSPFVVRNPHSTKPILLVCDHASRRIPLALGTLGLDPVARRCHLAVDIGAGQLTERLAEDLGVTAVLCQYSRLVVDCNRQLMDPGAYLEYGDGVVVHANRNLHREDKEARANAIYWPYHRAVEAEVERLRATGTDPLFVAIHSFTPVLNGESRSWEMGVLWDADPVSAQMFVHDLREAGYLVGDNEPYSGKAPQDFTIDNHAEPTGLPHVGIEIRQDLIHHDDGADKIAGVMQQVISSVSARLRPTEIAAGEPGVSGKRVS
jgi:predicted N-formylglutamate amidohydrolase